MSVCVRQRGPDLCARPPTLACSIMVCLPRILMIHRAPRFFSLQTGAHAIGTIGSVVGAGGGGVMTKGERCV